MKRPRRRNSETTFKELFVDPVLKSLSKTEMNYAYGVVTPTQDTLKHQSCNILQAKNLIFKNLDRVITHHILRNSVIQPLNPIPVLYVESRPEIEYERRLMSLVKFMEEYGERLSHEVFIKIFEKIIDEFRPAIFIELYHPNLKGPIDYLIEYMKTEFCHISLLYSTVDMKKMVEEEVSGRKVSDRLRRFFIPILGLLTLSGTVEPEVVKEIKMILGMRKVENILKDNTCDKDRVPMGISENLIPDLMKFVPSNPYFIDDTPLKFDLPRRIDKTAQLISIRKPTPVEKSQELILRRCASIDRMSPNKRRSLAKDKILFALTTKVNPLKSHKTLSDNEMSEDEDLSNTPTSLFNYIKIADKPVELTEYQKLKQMNPFSTLEISKKEPSILDEKPPLPTVSHPNQGDFMALVALEAMQVLPREWVTLLQNGNLTLMCRSLSQKGLIMIKCFTSMHRSPEQVLGVLLKSDLVKPGVSILSHFTVIDPRPYFDVIHFQLDTIKGLTPREWAARRSFLRDFPCEDGFTMLLGNMEADNILVNPKAVKGKVLNGGIVARPIGKKSSTISIVLKCELGGLIPMKIVHEFIIESMTKFVKDLRQYCDFISEYDSEAASDQGLDPEFVQ